MLSSDTRSCQHHCMQLARNRPMASVGSVLLLLPLLISAVAAAQSQSKQKPNKAQAFPFAHRVGTADADADGYYEGQHHDFVELAERKQTQCRYFGCNQWFDVCGIGSNCDTCRIGYHWTSHFTCRKEDYYNSYYGEDANFGKLGAQGTGECYWDVLLYRAQGGGYDNYCGWVPVIEGDTYRVGSVNGRCYFPDGDHCEPPLCNTLTVTVTGDMYVTRAYTQRNTDSRLECGFWCSIEDNCGDWLCNTAQGRSAVPDANRAANRSSVGIASTSEASSANYDHSGSWYYGNAVVISGQITSINGQKHTKDGRIVEGTMRYVPYMDVRTSTPVTGERPQDALIVTPQSYYIDFVKDEVRYYSYST